MNKKNVTEFVTVAKYRKIEMIIVEVIKQKKIETNAKEHRSK